MIYFVEAVGIGNIKIGFTDQSEAELRVAEWLTGCPVPVRILGTIPGDRDTESDLHRRFAAFQVAGAGREWFKPVPELLAVIPRVKPLACDGIEVADRSVQIKILTVGRKQFSRSLLSQLPEMSLLSWHEIMEEEYSKPRHGVVERFNVADYIGNQDIWGWVAADKAFSYRDECNSVEYRGGRWMIFQQNNHLFKSADYNYLVANDVGTPFQYTEVAPGSIEKPFWSTLVKIYAKRLIHPAWKQQLFIGV